jgi:conjugative transfer region protein (TIGR03748 family)
MKKTLLFLSLAITFNVSAEVMSLDGEQSVKKLNRYTNINTGYSAARTNPLKTVVSIKYPPAIKTVGQAIFYSLDESGYSLSKPENLTAEAKTLLSLPLPRSHRQFKYLSVETILKTLSGEAYSLLVDPVTRKINFCANISY